MQRNTTRIGLGVAGTVTFALSFAPLAAAVDNESEETQPAVTMQKQAPFLDLLYAAPHEDLHLGDTTTILIAQTLPASYTLTSMMANGNKCVFPYGAPAAEFIKTGTDTDADHVKRVIVSSGVDADGNGIDDHYEGAYDENGIAACKLKVVDEFENVDSKLIFINVGLPKKVVSEVTDPTIATTASTAATTAPTQATTAPTEASTSPTASVAGISVTAPGTLPRTGSTPWFQLTLGAVLAAAGLSMVRMSRRRSGPPESHVFEF